MKAAASASASARTSWKVSVVRAAAGLSFGAALIHGSVMAAHFREWWLYGLFFAIVTPLQLAWTAGVVRRPSRTRLLSVGAVGNLLVVGTWALSRTVGMPFGPDAGEAEAVGLKDVLASLDEVALAALVIAVLWGNPDGRGVVRFSEPAAWALVAVSVIAAMLGGH